MDSTRYLLIGGGLACSQAAKQLRQVDAAASITLAGAEPHPPYDRPPLSKEFLRGEKSKEELLYDPPSWYEQHGIRLLLGNSVTKLDLRQHTATLQDGETLRFDKALLATGGRPVHLNIPGGEQAGVHYFRTLDDATALAAGAKPGAGAVVIGAGFIGLEVAASLTQRGAQVTVIESQPHIWPRFADATLAQAIQRHCADKGVVFRTGETVVHIGRRDESLSVDLTSGVTLPCDLVCIGVGIVPNVELAHAAGLAVDNGIVADEYLQTSHPDVYAAGDVVNYVDPLFGKRRRVEHWGHAEYSGQLAARNMAGERAAYDLLTYVWSDIFDLHLEFAGDESEHDQMLIRGRVGDRSYMVLYLKRRRLTAYFGVNPAGKDLPPLQRLIRERKDLGGREHVLQDPGTPIKSLLSM